MTPDDDERERERTERWVRLGKLVGMNETQLRWRIIRWRERREAARRRVGSAVTHAAYEHAVCGNCGRIQDRSNKTCSGCEEPMAPRVAQVMRRAGAASGIPITPTLFLGVLIGLAYLRQVVSAGGSFMSFESATLVELGAHVPYLEMRGEWWRPGTAMFLHSGILHVAFNLLALAQIGPTVEEVSGRGKMMLAFIVTGLLGFAPGLILGPNAMTVTIGASGAVLGMAGMVAGWGQRYGTSVGKQARNQMLMWLVYTTVFGLMIGGIAHGAHFAGFTAGAVIGFASNPARPKSGTRSDALMLLVGGGLAVVFVGLIAFIPMLRRE